MLEISVRKPTSEETRLKVIELINIYKERITKIRINYNVYQGLPHEESPEEEWPVKIIIKDVIIYAHSLTAGYGGTGPHDLCKVLDAAGVVYDKNDILTQRSAKNGIIYLELTK